MTATPVLHYTGYNMGSLIDTMKFCKLVQLVSGGGTKTLRMLLGELSAPDTFKDYMYQHQSEVVDLRLIKDQKVLIANREVEKMDITLLCKLIMKLFKNKLTQAQIDLVNGIKAERDELVHSHLLEKTELNHSDFFTKRRKVERLLLNLSDTMKTAGVKQEMIKFIDKIGDTIPDIDEICETLREWCQSSPDTEKYIGRIDDELEQLRADYELKLLQGLSLTTTCKMSVKENICESFNIDYKRYVRSSEKPDQFDSELKDIALDQIKTSNITVLQGQKGSGKTKGAFSVAHTLTLGKIIKTKQCALIRNPSEMKAVNPKDLDLLVIDGIGNNRYMTKVWEESLRYLEKSLGNSDMKVIITTRVPINLEFTTVKGTFKLASQTVKLQGLDT